MSIAGKSAHNSAAVCGTSAFARAVLSRHSAIASKTLVDLFMLGLLMIQCFCELRRILHGVATVATLSDFNRLLSLFFDTLSLLPVVRRTLVVLRLDGHEVIENLLKASPVGGVSRVGGNGLTVSRCI